MKQRNTGWIALFLAPTCIIFLLIFAIPLVMVFATSLFDYRLLPRTFEFIGFSNFIKLFTQDAKFLPRDLHDSEYYLSVRYRHDLFESVQCAVRRFELSSQGNRSGTLTA